MALGGSRRAVSRGKSNGRSGSFGGGNRERKAKSQDREKDYKKIGSVWEKQDYPGQFNISVDNFHGDLIWKQVVKSEDGSQFRERYFKLKYISLFEPKSFNGNSLPENLKFNLTIDLQNDKAVELVGETDWQELPQEDDGGDGQADEDQE